MMKIAKLTASIFNASMPVHTPNISPASVIMKIIPDSRSNRIAEKEVRKIPVLKYYNVFHISQVEGVKPLEVPFKEVEPIEEAEKILGKKYTGKEE